MESIPLADLLGKGITQFELACYTADGDSYHTCTPSSVGWPSSDSAVGLIIDPPTHVPAQLRKSDALFAMPANKAQKISKEYLQRPEKYKTIGSGTYGTVVLYEDGEEKAALKVIRLESPDKIPLLRAQTLQELGVRDIPPHPNIVNVLGIAFSTSSEAVRLPDRLVIAMEYAPMSLSHAIASAPKEFMEGILPPRDKYRAVINPEDVRIMAYQMTRAVAHLHANHFRHNDIKPANFLLYGEKSAEYGVPWIRVALTDFGLMHSLERGGWTAEMQFGTTPYQPPEFLANNATATPVATTPASDIWSLACTIYELAVLGEERLFDAGAEIRRARKQTKKGEESKRLRAEEKKSVLNKIQLRLGKPPRQMIPKFFPDYEPAAEKIPASRITTRSKTIADKGIYAYLKHKLKKYGHNETLVDMLSRMLKWDPRKRSTASDLLLSHPYFAEEAGVRYSRQYPDAPAIASGLSYDDNLNVDPETTLVALKRRYESFQSRSALQQPSPMLLLPPPRELLNPKLRTYLDAANNYILQLSMQLPNHVMPVSSAAMTYLQVYAHTKNDAQRWNVRGAAGAKYAALASTIIAIEYRARRNIDKQRFLVPASQLIGLEKLDTVLLNAEILKIISALDFALGTPSMYDFIIEYGNHADLSDAMITAALLIGLSTFTRSIGNLVNRGPIVLAIASLSAVYFENAGVNKNVDARLRKLIKDDLLPAARHAYDGVTAYKDMVEFCNKSDSAVKPVFENAIGIRLGLL